MNYLITGHTGFKGSWYTRTLAQDGHNVSGYALQPDRESLFENGQVKRYLQNDIRGDIRDLSALESAMQRVRPDVVIHLAAQALVGPSFENPMETFTTNALGTANLLHCLMKSNTVKTCLVVTTDKVYAQSSNLYPKGISENGPLGPNDPYSSSKALADIWTQTIAKLNPHSKILIARAGNVIGSGDNSQYRLIPELIKAWTLNNIASIRNPEAIRPWQHVSDCILGYQLLITKADLLENGSFWNFSPKFEEHLSVRQVVEKAAAFWPRNAEWVEANKSSFEETKQLILDSSKARKILNWKPLKTIDESIKQAIIGDWNEEF
jgi:CDP-glucose 4,6-dehydratase